MNPKWISLALCLCAWANSPGQPRSRDADVVWRFDSSLVGSIARFNQQVYVGVSDHETGGNGLVCLDLATAGILWQTKHPPTHRPMGFEYYPITSSPAFAGDRVYYVSTNWEFVCVDAEGFRDGENDGTLKDEPLQSPADPDYVWKIDLTQDLGVSPVMAGDVGYLQPSPVVVGDTVYLVTGNGKSPWQSFAMNAPSFLALDRHTGAIRWKSNLPGDKIIWMQGSTPSPLGNRMLFPGGDGFLYALRSKDGTLAGKLDLNAVSGTNRRFFTNRFVAEGNVLLTSVGDCMEMGGRERTPLVAINTNRLTTNGSMDAVKWSYQHEKGGVWSIPVVSGETVFVNFFPNHLVALNLPDGKPKWESSIGFSSDRVSVYAAPLVIGKHVYVTTNGGQLHEVSAVTGEILRVWDFDGVMSEHASPIAVPGGLVVATREAIYRIRVATN